MPYFFGGPQTTEEYLVFSDSICMSEGENALVDLLEDLSKQQPQKSISQSKNAHVTRCSKPLC